MNQPLNSGAPRLLRATIARASAGTVPGLAAWALLALGAASALPVTRQASSRVLEPAPAAPRPADVPIRSAPLETGRPLSVTISRADWELDDLSRLRFGQLSVVHGDRPSLRVTRLSTRSALRFPGRVLSRRPEVKGNTLLVADFASGNRNRLGGFFGAYSRTPSVSSGRLSRSPDGRRSLLIELDKDPRGFCGLWVHVFDLEEPPAERWYLDVRAFSTLSFWIRGDMGGERVLLKLADAEWERREDALALGEVAEYLPSGRVEQAWQRVVVSLDRLPASLDPASLASIVFEGLSVGKSRVYVSQLAFSLRPEPLPELPAPDASVDSSLPEEMATWIWNTSELLEDPAARGALADFLMRERFTRVFLQIPTPEAAPHPTGGLELDHDRLRPLVALLRRAGLRVYALDGFAGYALPSHHAGVLRTIDEVAAYNRDVPEEARFYGIRYDIEPYLLPGFHGPRRERILRGLLKLTAESARRARAGGLAYGVDIPFWYDAPDEYTYEPIAVEFGGVRRPVSHHLIDMADDVTIMDYRTQAYGADGTIRHAEDELAYAAERGKPVFIGLETSELSDEELFEFRGEPHIGAVSRGHGGDRILLEAAGDSVRVWLLPAGEAGDLPASPLAAASDFLFSWPVSRRILVPAAKLSFAALGADALAVVMEETAREYGRRASFAGFALHHADSYRALLRPDSPDGPEP